MLELFSDECLHQRPNRSDTMGGSLEKLRPGPLAATSILCGSFAIFFENVNGITVICATVLRLRHVQVGNQLASRSILLALLCWALHGCWAIEQPRNSRLKVFPRWERFLMISAMRSWWTAWWARHYSALTPSLEYLVALAAAFVKSVHLKLPLPQEAAYLLEQHVADWKAGPWEVAKGAKGLLRCKNNAQEHQEWPNDLQWHKVLERDSVQCSAVGRCSSTLSKQGLMSPTLRYGTVLLRSYPVPLGLRVLRCFPDFCRDAARPQVAEPEDAPQLFHSIELGDTWPEADLISACIYLRGSQHLRVSERWKAAFPTSMWADSPSFLVP